MTDSRTTSMVQTIHDVAIVGAGPAGAATATHLARAGVRVVALDKATFPRDKPCAEYLSPAAEPLLARLGALGEINATQPSRLLGFRIFAPGGRMFQGDFAATRGRDGKSVFQSGLAVPRLVLDAALVAAARRAGAEVREDWHLGQLRRDSNNGIWTLRPTTDSSPVYARLLIAADGVHSTVARRLRLRVPGRLRKIALVAHMRGIGAIDEYGEMHVAGRHYVGIAPLEPRGMGDLCNVALVVDQHRDGPLLAGRPRDYFTDTLRTFPLLRDRIASAVFARKTLATSGLSVRVRRDAGDGYLLVGDASGYYDPFTGEGIFRALRGAEIAGEVAAAALGRGDVSGRTLSHYSALMREEFRGKRTIETIIQSAIRYPQLMDHMARRMTLNKTLADTVVAVTGDFLPASAVLNPAFLLRLLV